MIHIWCLHLSKLLFPIYITYKFLNFAIVIENNLAPFPYKLLSFNFKTLKFEKNSIDYPTPFMSLTLNPVWLISKLLNDCGIEVNI